MSTSVPRIRVSLGCLGLLLAGRSLAQQQTGEEVLLKADVKPRGIEFRVRSGGCTTKAQFGLETLSLAPLTVRLVRLRPDYCEASLASGKIIEFSYSELGAKPALTADETKNVVVVNVVAPP